MVTGDCNPGLVLLTKKNVLTDTRLHNVTIKSRRLSRMSGTETGRNDMRIENLRATFDRSGHLIGGRCLPVLRHFTGKAVQNFLRNCKGHVLYRFFGYDGRLLYVGITADLRQRCKQGHADREWWRSVAFVTIDNMFNDRAELERAELVAIGRENPVYNVAGRVRHSTIEGCPGSGLALSSPPVYALADALWGSRQNLQSL